MTIANERYRHAGNIFPLLLTMALVSCSGAGVKRVDPVYCANDDPLHMSNFIESWNVQYSDDEQWLIDTYKKASNDQQRSLFRCDAGKNICLNIQYVGECLVQAEIVAINTDFKSWGGAAIDLKRRVVWSKLIRTLDPEISKTAENVLDEALYENLRNDVPNSSSSASTDNIQYITKMNKKYILLQGIPAQPE